MTALSITRTDLTVEQLRQAATRESDPKAVRRILAIAMVLDGHSRQAAADAQAMDRQTLRDWVIRYNECGIDGLVDRPRSGRPPLLSAEQEAELETWVDQGPELAKDGVVRWRRFDLRERIRQRFGVKMHERNVGKILRRLNSAAFRSALNIPRAMTRRRKLLKKLRRAAPGRARVAECHGSGIRNMVPG